MPSVALGSTLVVVGGLLNGSWNLPTKETAPHQVVAISSGWSWDHVWIVFQIMQAGLNAVVITSAVTVPVLSEVYSETRASDLALVCAFCTLWGFGSLSFGMSIKLLGMAVGTSVPMGVIQVIGTCLPLFQDWESVTLKTGLLTLFSVIFGLAGFSLSALAAHCKSKAAEGGEICSEQSRIDGDDLVHGVASEGETMPAVRRRSIAKHGHNTKIDTSALYGTVSAAQSQTISAQIAEDTLPASVSADQLSVHTSSGDMSKEYAAAPEALTPPAETSMLMGLVVALFSGVTSSMLQFAFVFGSGMVQQAERQGVSKIAAPMVVWLLAFEISAIPNIIVSAIKIWRCKAWHGFTEVSTEQGLKSTALCIVMGSFFMGHIHLYGAGASLIGSLGAAIAWPILMSVTVLTSQFWSLVLQEWKGAPAVAHYLSTASILALIASVVFAACAGM